MMADLANPDWVFVWPAYALTAAAFAGLAGATIWRLRKWSRAARGQLR